MVVPGIHHFLSRLRELQKLATRHRLIRISKDCHEDLLPMLRFLNIAKQGIDMNLVAFRCLTHVYRLDSCPFSLGGYSDEGFAWRFEIPEDLRFRASNNLLDRHHLPALISSYLAGDNTSSKKLPATKDSTV